jgi:hypothetical protein
MPSFQGRTDQKLTIKLTSQILLVNWGAEVMPLGGQVTLEIRTVYVAEGAPVGIRIYNRKGQDISRLNGSVYSNYYRVLYNVPFSVEGPLFAEVELPKHSLKAISTALELGPMVTFSNLRWLDKDGKTVSTAQIGDTVAMCASVSGLPRKDRVELQLFCKYNLQRRRCRKNPCQCVIEGRKRGCPTEISFA